MAPGIVVRLFANPWPESVPTERLTQILETVARHRAEDLEERAASGEYAHAMISIAILDPTAPLTRPTDEALLAVIEIGEGAANATPNALGKACAHRDHGVDFGTLLMAQRHRIADGEFRRGLSSDVNGTITGASGLTGIQDQFQAGVAAAELNYGVGAARIEWEETNSFRWSTSDGQPSERYRALAHRDALVTVEL